MNKLQLTGKQAKILFAIGCFLMAIFGSKAFVINPHLYIGKSAVSAATTDYLWGFYALFLWAMFYVTYAMLRLKIRVGAALFGLLFGVLNFLGTSLFAYDTWEFIGITLSWGEAIFKCIGQGIVMMTALTLVENRLSVHAAKSKPEQITGQQVPAAPQWLKRLVTMYQRHTVLFCAVLLWICWIPYMLAFYPGTVISDMCVMVREFFGLEPMKTWHSVFITYVFGACIWLGRMLGSDNYGTLIYMVLQSTLMAYALGYCIRYLRVLGAGTGWQLAALAFFGITPIWGCYAMMIGKDTIYMSLLLLFTLQTLTLARDGNGTLTCMRELAGFGATATLACLWRNNGMHVVIPTVALILLFLVRGKRRWQVAVPLTAAVVLTLLFHNVLTPALGIIDNSSSGLYSIAFQQTARTARHHRNELTEDEKREIDHILDLEKIRYVYEPWISDPVKDTFRQFAQGADIEKEALARYRKTWFSMMQKYPVTYLQAFIGNNSSYYAFTPKYDGITYNQQAGLRFVFSNYWESGEGMLHTTLPKTLEPVRKLMMGLVQRWWTLPILSFLYVLPFYTWLLVAAGISLAHQRRWRDLVAFTPAFLSFVVCLVSPVDDYLRYFLPIVAMTIPLLAFVTHPRHNETCFSSGAPLFTPAEKSGNHIQNGQETDQVYAGKTEQHVPRNGGMQWEPCINRQQDKNQAE